MNPTMEMRQWWPLVGAGVGLTSPSLQKDLLGFHSDAHWQQNGVESIYLFLQPLTFLLKS